MTAGAPMWGEITEFLTVERLAAVEDEVPTEHEAWIVEVLATKLHMTPAEIDRLSDEEAREHVLAYWSRPSGPSAAPRRRHQLDEAGAQIELVEREDGVIELRPHIAVPADQAWFWTDRWQEAEREVDEHVRRGEVTVHGDEESFLEHLDSLADEE